MRYFITIFASFSLLFTSSCDLFDNDLELPPITTDGNNTFGCMVDGVLFLPQASGGAGVYAELGAYADTVSISIYAYNVSTDQTLVIYFSDSPTLEVGKVYNLNSSISSVDYLEYGKNPPCSYETVISGIIKLLKFDVTNTSKIIAGIFEFTASSIDCKDEITVTQGRFDISDVQ